MSIRKKKILKSLKDITGEGTKLEESKKSKEHKQKEYFKILLEDLEQLLSNSNTLLTLGVDLSIYEDLHFKVIEQIVCEHYGEAQGILVFWWVNSKIENPSAPRVVKNNEGKEYKITTPNQLWNFIKKYTQTNA